MFDINFCEKFWSRICMFWINIFQKIWQDCQFRPQKCKFDVLLTHRKLKKGYGRGEKGNSKLLCWNRGYFFSFQNSEWEILINFQRVVFSFLFEIFLEQILNLQGFWFSSWDFFYWFLLCQISVACGPLFCIEWNERNTKGRMLQNLISIFFFDVFLESFR